MKKTTRTTTGKFASTYDQGALLEIAHAVIQIALADGTLRPSRHQVGRVEVSQARYNEARAIAGYPDSPDASGLCKRLSLTWAELYKLATAASFQTRAITLGHRQPLGADPKRRFSRVECLDAIKLISKRLQRTPQPADYDAERQTILRQSRRAWKTRGTHEK